jgi:hypothetical protein
MAAAGLGLSGRLSDEYDARSARQRDDRPHVHGMPAAPALLHFPA